MLLKTHSLKLQVFLKTFPCLIIVYGISEPSWYVRSMKNLLIIFAVLMTQTGFAQCDGKETLYPYIDPTDGKVFTARTKAYKPARSTKVPAVFILPPIVGETVLDRRLGEKFCQNGIAAYILNVVKVIPTEEENLDLMVHDNSYVRALAGLRVVMKSLQSDNSLNGRYGLMGTSLGGMLAAYIAGSESAIIASVVVVGAGNVPGVLTYSDQELVRAQREARYGIFNLKSDQEYEDLLKPLVPNDPINVAHQVAPGSMYLFLALNDTTVPTKYQQELRSKVPSPLVYEMSGNHFNGIVKAGTIHAGKIINFFKRKLSN